MFGKSFSSALSAIETDERQAAMSRYVELIHLCMSSDPEVRKTAATPEAVAEMRQITAKLGKSAADVARDESIVAEFERQKDASHGLIDAQAAHEKAEQAAKAAELKYAQEVASAASRRDHVFNKRNDAQSTVNVAENAQRICKGLLRKAPELFRPNDRKYLKLVEMYCTANGGGATRVLYQEPELESPAK